MTHTSAGIGKARTHVHPLQTRGATLSAGVPPRHVRLHICLTLISEAVIIACTHVPPEPVVKVHLPAIEDATVQRFIRELHRGDEVELTYTEAIAGERHAGALP